jgi:hypothetical protein
MAVKMAIGRLLALKNPSTVGTEEYQMQRNEWNVLLQ